jgi:hypothetical protein
VIFEDGMPLVGLVLGGALDRGIGRIADAPARRPGLDEGR